MKTDFSEVIGHRAVRIIGAEKLGFNFVKSNNR